MEVVTHNYDIENITSMNVLCCNLNTQKVIYRGNHCPQVSEKLCCPLCFKCKDMFCSEQNNKGIYLSNVSGHS